MQHLSKLADKGQDLNLSIILTVVSGKESMQTCLKALYPQVDFNNSEVIVPYDKWSQNIGELAEEFPQVCFHFIEDLGLAEDTEVASHEHRLYDRRRAIGLRLTSGRIIAMTEDHATPASDWVAQILKAHEESFQIIGGAIENGIDKPLNWAWYYCDFGRYGRPFPTGEINYVSDVNVSYKKEALDSVQDIWYEAYRETILHWTLQEKGSKLILNGNIVVYQQRPKTSLFKAFRERIQWGRVFAETRVAVSSISRRFIYAIGSIILPPLLLIRLLRNMRRHQRTVTQIIQTIPFAFLLLIGWSLGELLGYVFGLPDVVASELEVAKSNFPKPIS